MINWILQELNKMGYVIPIEDGSHDDLVLLEMAKIVGGFVISNDKFRDHLDIAALEDVIKGRVVRFDFRAIPHEVVKNKKTYGNPKKLK
jgi:hypothetical protein